MRRARLEMAAVVDVASAQQGFGIEADASIAASRYGGIAEFDPPSTVEPAMKHLSRYALVAALALHVALIAALLYWSGWRVGALLSLPLLATLPGLLRARTYTAGWASMLLVFYIALLLSEGVAMPLRKPFAQALSVIAVLDFVSLVLFVRLSARERAALASQTESSAGAAH